MRRGFLLLKTPSVFGYVTVQTLENSSQGGSFRHASNMNTARPMMEILLYAIGVECLG
jgi:hypothetical protein